MRPAISPSTSLSDSRARWLYPLALALTVAFASSRSQIAAPNVVNIDKAAHLLVFGLMATLVLRSPGMRRAWAAVLLVSIFGIMDEWRQSLTPGRSVEIADWVADSSGALIAVFVYRYWPLYRRLLEAPLRLRKRSVASVSNAAPDPVS